MGRRARAMAAAAALASALAGCGGPGVDQLAAGPKAVVAEVRSGDARSSSGGMGSQAGWMTDHR